ncbi:GNAT family N-acetyltransferase [Pseudotenacibaculum haliotis]|uniref:GNAT family N-acetyltransferase n=1 Tax=Pseudotenacibaculum haliotis TaxID=1862138 RepID=A0ABW5LRP4_9FLAO
MIIKVPSTASEFEQLHQLNYSTFVEEIPQHKERADRKLIDRFHSKNNYLIAVKGNKVIGMVCYNTIRPFSLEEKQVKIDDHIPLGCKVAEIRLLAVEKKWRKTTVTFRLLQQLIKELKRNGVSMGLISATTREFKFYTKIGFQTFGEVIGKKNAYYQPMYIFIENLKKEFKDD